MAKPKSTIKYAAFHVKKDSRGKPRINRDGSQSILALIRYPNEDPFSQTFKTRADAEEWAISRIKDLTSQKGRTVRPGLATLTISKLINEYLEDPDIKNMKSYGFYSDLGNWWKEHHGKTKIFDVGPELLRDARKQLMTSGRYGIRSAATVNRYLATMRLIWNWGRAAGWIAQERTWPTRLLLKEPPGRNRYLSTAELNGLLKAAESDPVMRAAILVSVATGLRQGELLRLKWADIDVKGSAVMIHVTKNKTPRRVHLTSQAVVALKTLWADERKAPSSAARVFLLPDGQPFKQYHLEARWRPIKRAAKLENFRWHDLRHTCASYLAQHGATLLEIGSVLGHKTPSMTMRYAHLVQGAPVKGHSALDDLLKGT